MDGDTRVGKAGPEAACSAQPVAFMLLIAIETLCIVRRARLTRVA